MKKISFAVLFLALVSFCLSCGVTERYGKKGKGHPKSPAGETQRHTDPDKKTISSSEELDESAKGLKIGVVLPLTGELSGFGQAVLEGILVAREELLENGFENIEFEFIDNEESYSDGSIRSLEIAEHLRDEGVSAIIGPLTTPSVVVTAMTLAPDSILVLSPTSSAYDLPRVAGNVVSLNSPSSTLSRKIARFAVNELNLFTFSVLYPSNPYGQVMTESFIDEIERLGGKVVITSSFPPSQTTNENEIKKIALYNTDALYIPARSEDVIQIAPQIPYYGIYDAILLGADGWNYEDVARKGDNYVEGVYFSDSFFPESQELVFEKFSDPYILQYRKEPTRIAGWGYDALQMIVDAYDRGGARPGELLEAFFETERFEGATAVYGMVDGQLEREGYLFTISGGEIVTLESNVTDSSSLNTIETQGGVWNENGG